MEKTAGTIFIIRLGRRDHQRNITGIMNWTGYTRIVYPNKGGGAGGTVNGLQIHNGWLQSVIQYDSMGKVIAPELVNGEGTKIFKYFNGQNILKVI